MSSLNCAFAITKVIFACLFHLTHCLEDLISYFLIERGDIHVICSCIDMPHFWVRKSQSEPVLYFALGSRISWLTECELLIIYFLQGCLMRSWECRSASIVRPLVFAFGTTLSSTCRSLCGRWLSTLGRSLTLGWCPFLVTSSTASPMLATPDCSKHWSSMTSSQPL